MENQLETLKVLDGSGKYAIDLNPKSETYECVMFLNGGVEGAWRRQRKAKENELAMARTKLAKLQEEAKSS